MKSRKMDKRNKRIKLTVGLVVLSLVLGLLTHPLVIYEVAATTTMFYATTSGGVANHTNVRGIPDNMYANSTFPAALESVWGGGFAIGTGTITIVEIAIEYHVSAAAFDDEMILKYSLDGGATWGATTRTWVSANTTDVQVFLNVTADRTWTWTNISNLRVQVDFDRIKGADGITARVDACFVRVTAVVADTTPPTYLGAGHNQTVAGVPTLFHIRYDDNLALQPAGQWIFSTNNTGVWVNDTAVNWTATPGWANVTRTLNSTVGVTIGYRWFARDNAGNWNNTPIYTLTTTAPAVVSITVVPTSYDFGFLALNTINATANDTFNATNTGNVPINLTFRATNTANWALASTVGTNAFRLDQDVANGTSWTPLTTTAAQIDANNIAVGASRLFELRMHTPTSTTFFTQQTTTVTVGAVQA